MGDERIDLDEGPLVQKELQPLPRGELPLLMLCLDPLLAPPELSLAPQLGQPPELLLHRHRPLPGRGVVSAGAGGRRIGRGTAGTTCRFQISTR